MWRQPPISQLCFQMSPEAVCGLPEKILVPQGLEIRFGHGSMLFFSSLNALFLAIWRSSPNSFSAILSSNFFFNIDFLAKSSVTFALSYLSQQAWLLSLAWPIHFLWGTHFGDVVWSITDAFFTEFNPIYYLFLKLKTVTSDTFILV